MDLHRAYGGVVPEIAARSHIEVILPVIQQALDEAAMNWDDIDGIAVTYGAGLGGSLLVGVMAARTIAQIKNKPLYGCNHVEGHVYANFLTETTLDGYTMPTTAPEFPLLAIIVSGGHSQLVLFRDHFDYTLLGRTQDDAIGEAFDKVAKLLGLPYPGGPSVGKAAVNGNARAIAIPKAKVGRYDFSFSGPKTAVLRQVQALCGVAHDFPSYELSERLSEAQKADVAASFQRVACETIVDKAVVAVEEFAPASIVLAGGVAASPELRRQLSAALPSYNIQYPDPKLCTDNGAMIATLGCFKATLGVTPDDPLTLAIAPNLKM